MVIKEGEILKAQTLGKWAYLAIEKHFHKILKNEEDVIKDRDPEALHQMRVGMRRLRSATTGFDGALDLPKAAREKKIAKIARTLGKLRDLDVLLEAIANRYKPGLPSREADLLEKALTQLAKRRREALEEVREMLDREGYKLLKQALKAWLKQPSYREIAAMPIQLVLPDLLLPCTSELFLHPGWLVGIKVKDAVIEQFDSLKPKAIEEYIIEQGPSLHSLRKQVKRVRYQMSSFSPLYGEEYANYVDDLKAIQEVLGEIQDSVVLNEVLTEVLGEEMESELPTLAEALSQSRHGAWEKWQSLQQRYLHPKTRCDFRAQLQKPLQATKDAQLASSALDGASPDN